MRVFLYGIFLVLCVSIQAGERNQKTRSVEFRQLKSRVEERLSSSCPELPIFRPPQISEELLDRDNLIKAGVIILEDEEPNEGNDEGTIITASSAE